MGTKVSSLARDPVDDGYKAPDAHRAWLAWQLATKEAVAVWATAKPVYFYHRGTERHW